MKFFRLNALILARVAVAALYNERLAVLREYLNRVERNTCTKRFR